MIRKVKPTDARAVFEVLEAAQKASSVPLGPSWTEAQIADECLQFGLVAEENSAVKAFVLWRDSSVAFEITFLATNPSDQRSGLMRSLISHLKSSKPSERAIWLEVHEKNQAARTLYEASGFTESGRRPRYYADGGTAILYNYG